MRQIVAITHSEDFNINGIFAELRDEGWELYSTDEGGPSDTSGDYTVEDILLHCAAKNGKFVIHGPYDGHSIKHNAAKHNIAILGICILDGKKSAEILASNDVSCFPLRFFCHDQSSTAKEVLSAIVMNFKPASLVVAL